MLLFGGMELDNERSPVEWLLYFLNGFNTNNITPFEAEGAVTSTTFRSSNYSNVFPESPSADPDSIEVRFVGTDFGFTTEGGVSGFGTISEIQIRATVNGQPVFRTFQFFQPVDLAQILALTTNSGNGPNSLEDLFNFLELVIPSESSFIDNGTNFDDLMKGHNGDDQLFGNDGSDTLIGFKGDDYFFGNKGNDLLKGGSGNDTLGGDGGKDRLFGGNGLDSLLGNNGNDTLRGEGGDDVLSGGKGRDNIKGGKGGDFIEGGADQDLLIGGRGNDTILGGGGADAIISGAGDDELRGGAGADQFIFSAGDGSDTIKDFNPHQDTLALRGLTQLDELTFSEANGNVVISYQDYEIIIEGVSLGQIQSDDIFGL